MIKSSAFQQLSLILKPYKWHLVIALFLTLLPAYVTVWSPYLIGRLVDEGIVARDVHMLTLFLGAVIALKVLLFVFNGLVTYCLTWFGSQLLVDYRDYLLKRVLSYPIHYFDKMPAGRLTTRLTSDIGTLQELFSSALVPLIGSIFLIFGVMVGMLVINWRLAVVSFTIVPALVWITMIFHDRIRRRFGVMRQSLSALNSFSGESFAGNRDLQVFDALSMNQAEFEQKSRRLQVRFVEAVREYAVFNPTIPLITSMMVVLIMLYGGWQIFKGSMSVGEVVAFLAYAASFEGPIRDFAEKYTVFQQALSAVDRLVEVSDHQPEPDEGTLEYPGALPIEFKDVSFAYDARLKPALSHIDFKTQPGQKIALLGETGSGKTTTCSLLMRFYEASAGKVLIGGQPIENYSLDSLRSRTGWVSQDVVLFSASLRDNLRFFDTTITDAQIWKTLERIQLKGWVQELPNGLDEHLSERGSTVSTGQRQLISLARALLREPSILIFDEATSYVDSQTEYLLQKAVEDLFHSPEYKNLTAFFVAHRLSTLRRCDRMLVFRHGEIVEDGTYEELMKLNGYAAKLYQEQFRRLA